MLTAAGYVDIGMDHFALTTDDLYTAWKTTKLHRNFMGYTTQHTSILLGLGVSSIIDVGGGFAQNKKSIHEYYEAIQQKELPVFKGYFLNDEDKAFRNYILSISCRDYAVFRKEDRRLIEKYVLPQLQQPLDDGLINMNDDGLVVTETGRQFIRNICSAFDLYLQREIITPMFSKAI